jgi:hypothetical protein
MAPKQAGIGRTMIADNGTHPSLRADRACTLDKSAVAH